MNNFLTKIFVCLSLTLTIAADSQSQVFKTKERALKETFAECDTVVRNVLFLKDTEIETIQKRAKAKVESKMVTYYTGLTKNKPSAYAFIISDVIRTKPGTFFVHLNANGVVQHVEMLAFYEPMDYLPIGKWFGLFKDKILNNQLWPRREIHAVTGATLTVRAVTKGVRKVIAIYEVALAKTEPNN